MQEHGESFMAGEIAKAMAEGESERNLQLLERISGLHLALSRAAEREARNLLVIQRLESESECDRAKIGELQDELAEATKRCEESSKAIADLTAWSRGLEKAIQDRAIAENLQPGQRLGAPPSTRAQAEALAKAMRQKTDALWAGYDGGPAVGKLNTQILEHSNTKTPRYDYDPAWEVGEEEFVSKYYFTPDADLVLRAYIAPPVNDPLGTMEWKYILINRAREKILQMNESDAQRIVPPNLLEHSKNWIYTRFRWIRESPADGAYSGRPWDDTWPEAEEKKEGAISWKQIDEVATYGAVSLYSSLPWRELISVQLPVPLIKSTADPQPSKKEESRPSSEGGKTPPSSSKKRRR